MKQTQHNAHTGVAAPRPSAAPAEAQPQAQARDADTEAVIAAMLALAASRDPLPHLHAWIDIDLSMAQLRALMVVAHRTQQALPTVVGDVAERLGITLSTASHLVERLVRADMLTRQSDPTDRRRTLLQPTATATGMLDSLRADGVAQMRHWLQHLDDDALSALAIGMRALQNAARQHRAPHQPDTIATTAPSPATAAAERAASDRHTATTTAPPASEGAMSLLTPVRAARAPEGA